jgi:hypothetical protein
MDVTENGVTERVVSEGDVTDSGGADSSSDSESSSEHDATDADDDTDNTAADTAGTCVSIELHVTLQYIVHMLRSSSD